MSTLTIQNSIIIQAPVSEVWDALVNPALTKKYMFGCEAISDWKPGSSLEWKMMHEGKELVAVKGKVVKIMPEQFLSYTVIDPHSSIPDIPENYLTVTYELKPNSGATVFTVTQGDYNKVADGEKRYRESYNDGEGWKPILVAIKKLVEESNN